MSETAKVHSHSGGDVGKIQVCGQENSYDMSVDLVRTSDTSSSFLLCSFDEVCVAFNGGKDCTVILDLLHSVLKK